MPSGVYPRKHKSPKGTPTHNSWAAMLQRCYYKKHKHYNNYGGRGITVCSRWRHSYDNFLQDMGTRPVDTTLDRKNNDKGYTPNNCKWSTRTQQQKNSRPMKNGKLNLEKAKAIRLERLTHGTTMRKLAIDHAVSVGTICLVINNKIWRTI